MLRFKEKDLVLFRREKINTLEEERLLNKSFMKLFKVMKKDSHYTYKLNLFTYWRIYNRFYNCHLKKYYVSETLKNSN